MRTTLLLAVALGCGLVAAIGALQYVKKAPVAPAAPQEMQRLLVASQEININDKFTADNVQEVEWPKKQVPFGAVESLDALENRFASVRLYVGEPIMMGKTMGMDDSGALKVPNGSRVVSVKVTADSAVSNLIRPGDHVDVVAVLRKCADNPTPRSKTILESIRVFAVNSEMGRSPDRDKIVPDARTVSLLLTPEQVERLIMAAELGQIKLSLRGIDDKGMAPTEGCTVESILGRRSNERPGPERLTAAPAPRPLAGEVRWSMDICSPDGAERYRWKDNDPFPQRDQLDKSPRQRNRAGATQKLPAAGTPDGNSNRTDDTDEDEDDTDSSPAPAPNARPLEVAAGRTAG
jgi:pilus assembly protein CpaB